MKRVALTVLLAVLVAGATGTSVLAKGAMCTDGVTLEDRVPPEPGLLSAWVAARHEQLLERPAYLEIDGQARTTTWGELGIELDMTETENALRAALVERGECTEFSRLKRRYAPKPPDAVAVAPRFAFNRDRARRALSALAPSLAVEPVDARLDLRAHQRIDDRPGRELDVEATLAAVASGPREEGASFPLITIAIAPQVTAASLADVDVAQVLASFETDFARFPKSRVPNIQRAAELLNGAVIGPGTELSFNRTVGPRVLERGFKKAPVIVADVTEDGIGGGVCQVASTLHAAARYGGLDVVNRRSHSRPSGYAPLGLDATVIDGEVDLKLRNPYKTPLIVHAFLPTRTTLRVELLGRGPVKHVSHGFNVEKKETFERLVLVRSDFPPNQIKKHQKGTTGYEGYSTVRVEDQDGTVTTRRYESRYYPAPEVFWVGSAVQPSDLPPLPEGVTKVTFAAFGAPRAPSEPTNP